MQLWPVDLFARRTALAQLATRSANELNGGSNMLWSSLTMSIPPRASRYVWSASSSTDSPSGFSTAHTSGLPRTPTSSRTDLRPYRGPL